MSFYAVKKGFKPGIYTTWEECKKQTNGYSNAIFKKFKTEQEAKDFINQKTPKSNSSKKTIKKVSSKKKKKKNTNKTSNFQPATIYKSQNHNITNSKNKTVVITPTIQSTKVISNNNSNSSLNLPKVYAFVDGSFNETTRVYGYGGFVVINGEKHILQGKGNDIDMAKMQNVAGEILGSIAAMQFAIDNHLHTITILYDYFGIEKWTTGEWEAKLNYTKAYKQFFDLTKNYVNIKFQKVKAHSNIDGNEEADKLAKQAVGLR